MWPTRKARPAPPAATPPSRTDQGRPRPWPQVIFALTSLVVALFVIRMLQDVLGAFILGALLAFVMEPGVNRLHRLGVPRMVAVVVVLCGFVLVAASVVSMFIPILNDEVSKFHAKVPAIAATAQQQLDHLRGTRTIEIYGFQLDLAPLAGQVSDRSREFLVGQFSNALGLSLAAITTLLQILLMLIIAFLVSLDPHSIRNLARGLVPRDYRSDFDDLWGRLKSMLYSYLRGQLIIGTIIGITCGLALWALHVDYPLALGVLAGLTALVPYLGPFVGAIPAVVVALSVSPLQALLVAIAYLVISNVVLNFVYPKVVGDAVNLPPLVVIIAFIAGFSVGGILGMFVAVPLAASLRILFDYLHPRVYGTEA